MKMQRRWLGRIWEHLKSVLDLSDVTSLRLRKQGRIYYLNSKNDKNMRISNILTLLFVLPLNNKIINL